MDERDYAAVIKLVPFSHLLLASIVQMLERDYPALIMLGSGFKQ